MQLFLHLTVAPHCSINLCKLTKMTIGASADHEHVLNMLSVDSVRHKSHAASACLLQLNIFTESTNGTVLLFRTLTTVSSLLLNFPAEVLFLTRACFFLPLQATKHTFTMEKW